jgi:hypothetical protein
LHISGGECGERGGGKSVFCYLEGKRSPKEVNTCPCSHLLIKNVAINTYSEVALQPGQLRRGL